MANKTVDAMLKAIEPRYAIFNTIPICECHYLCNNTTDIGNDTLVPIVQYIPAWLPGSSVKNEALEQRKLVEDTVSLPLEDVKEQLVGCYHKYRISKCDFIINIGPRNCPTFSCI